MLFKHHKVMTSFTCVYINLARSLDKETDVYPLNISHVVRTQKNPLTEDGRKNPFPYSTSAADIFEKVWAKIWKISE